MLVDKQTVFENHHHQTNAYLIVNFVYVNPLSNIGSQNLLKPLVVI